MHPVELLVFERDQVADSARVLLEREFSFEATVTEVQAPLTEIVAVDDFFEWMSALRPLTQRIVIFLVPNNLFAADHEIVSEARADRIVIATSKLTLESLPRVLRHEIGLALGLKVHWGCVMSRSFVGNPVFCVECRKTLLKLGIAWRADTSTQS